jgi:hypothetical protein
MRADSGIGQRVYIECLVQKSTGPEQLDIIVRDVYPANFNAPTLSEVVARTIANARVVLREMIDGKSDDWQKQFTRKVPLSRTILHREPEKIVLPLDAARFRASYESSLRVVFSGRVEQAPQQPGEIRLHPLAGLVEEDEMQGWLMCDVGHFRFHTVNKDGWDPLIEVVVTNHVPDSLRVHMENYVRSEDDPIDDFF